MLGEHPQVTARTSDLVSVVMPAHNAGSSIGSSLRSVLGQTHRALDIIVVDDGSTDNTAAIVSAIAGADHRVRLLRQANTGVAAARNAGIRAAEADLVAFIDADDLWHPVKIEKQLALLREAGERVGVVYAWACFIDASDHPDGRCFAPHDNGDVYAALVLHNIVGNGSAALVRKPCLIECGGFDATLRERQAQGCEDLKLWLSIAEEYDFALVPEFLVGYRQDAGSMSRNVREMMRSYALVIEEARARHPEIPACVFQWSRAKFSFYLAENCAFSGRWGSAVLLWLDALRRDPAILRSIRLRRARARLRMVFGLAASDGTPHRILVQMPYLMHDLEKLADWLPTRSVGLERRRRNFVAGVHVRQQCPPVHSPQLRQQGFPNHRSLLDQTLDRSPQ